MYGAVLDAAYTLRAQLSDLAAGTRMFLVAAVEAAATRWREDDQGIWEMRGNFPQAFSHLGLVTAAQALADAEHAPPRRRDDGPKSCLLNLPDPEDRSHS